MPIRHACATFSFNNIGRASIWALAAMAASFITNADARLIRDHSNVSMGGSAYALNVTPVFDLVLNFPAGRNITCATSNATQGADPWLHAFVYNQGGAQQEIARDDDSAGGLNARMAFTAPANGKVRIVMRAAGKGAGGAADLKCDGYQTLRNVPAGGAFKTVEGYRKYENLLTVPLPGGPRGHRVYIIDPETGRVLQRHASGASESVLAVNLPASFVVMIGSFAGDIPVTPGTDGVANPLTDAVVSRDVARRGATSGGGASGPAAGARPEVAILPDRALDAKSAPRPADAPGEIRLIRNDLYLGGHDPDNDGLGTELETHIGTCTTLTEIAGGNWECSRSVDARDTDGDGLSDRLELMGKPEKAPYQLLPRWGADPRHKDVFIEVDFWQWNDTETPRKLSRTVALDMAKIYGDPETSALFRLAHAQSLNNPDLKAGISVHLDTGMNPPAGAPLAELATYGDWGGYSAIRSDCTGSGCWKTVIDTAMHSNRKAIFHYAFGHPGGGGQAPHHSIGLNMPIDSSVGASHEFGHTLGLDHGGPTDIGPDANCKPNYPSIMSYAYDSISAFSDGYGRSALNNAALTERAHVAQPTSGPGVAYLTHLRDIFRYNVNMTAGDVDWNRDGVISDGTVRAYANNDHSSCEFTRVNQMNAAGFADGAVTLTRLGASTILLYIDEANRRLRLEHTTNSLACPANTGSCGPALQPVAVDGSWNANIDAVDAHPVGSGAQKKLLVVFRKGASLFETTMSSGFVWSAPVSIAVSSGAIDELSLAGGATESFLAYKDTSGKAVLKRRDASGVWGADEIVALSSGSALAALGTGSSPGILLSGGRLFGAFPVGQSGTIGLYERSAADGRWSITPWQMSYNTSIGRPALAMEPVASQSPMPGRMRIMYISRGSADKDIIRMMTLEAIGLGASATLKVTDEIHDNVWYYGNGVDLLFEQGVDTNLRAAVASALQSDPPVGHIVNLRPKADGVVFQVYRNWNDWEALGIDLCRTLKTAGADVNCPAWPYAAQLQPTPPPPSQSTPPSSGKTLQQCLADCADILDSCRASGQSAGICVKERAQCVAQCRR